jgi:transglutaminase-like putative cysteine protease
VSALPRPPESAALRPLAWACAAFAGGMLLHVDRVPVWASVACVGLILWRLAATRRGLWLPGTITRALLALGMAAVVLARFHTLNGLAAGTTLLLLMAALKLLETRGTRDQLVLIGAGLFLLLAACLDRQDLARTPFYALQAWLCCAALAALATPTLPARAAWQLAGRALLFALPLAALLFVFFPRLPGSFWAIPRSGAALTGLSDSMTPGSIAHLVADYSTAFRVSFEGARPANDALYWRGPVLHEFDGQTWRRAENAAHPRQRLEYTGAPVRYRVSLAPPRRRFWFALDLPASTAAPRVELTYDSLLLGSDPINEPVSYQAVSYLRARALDPLGAAARREDTALPPRANPRTQELAQTLYQRAGTDAAFVAGALDYLRSGGFVYSLEPQPLGRDAMDELLFRTREGFCEHYAAAFVTLMRAAHVPARIVTGYLGGEWNPVGEFLEVRQADAHAWAEVWLEGRGWSRVDPTAVVAPERLRRGMLDLMPNAFSASDRLLYGSPWFRGVLQRWAAANAWWGDHVVKFDYASQLDLLTRLGIRSPDARDLGWGFTAALLLWLTFIAWYVGRRERRPAPDALARAYLRLCRKLARIGTPRAPHQGPLAYLAAIAAQRPDLGARVAALIARYAHLRYGPSGGGRDADEIAAFARAVARLKLPRAAPR